LGRGVFSSIIEGGKINMRVRIKVEKTFPRKVHVEEEVKGKPNMDKR